MTLQAKLYHLRLQADMSLRQAAKASGLSFGYISHIENGRTTPGPQALLQLSKAYKVHKKELYDLITYKEPLPFTFIRNLYHYFTTNSEISDTDFTNLAIRHNIIHPKTLNLKLKEKDK